MITNLPLRSIFFQSDITRMMKWASELGNFDIKFIPRATIKSQILVDFMAKFGPLKENEGITLEWVLKTDGASN